MNFQQKTAITFIFFQIYYIYYFWPILFSFFINIIYLNNDKFDPDLCKFLYYLDWILIVIQLFWIIFYVWSNHLLLQFIQTIQIVICIYLLIYLPLKNKKSMAEQTQKIKKMQFILYIMILVFGAIAFFYGDLINNQLNSYIQSYIQSYIEPTMNYIKLC